MAGLSHILVSEGGNHLKSLMIEPEFRQQIATVLSLDYYELCEKLTSLLCLYHHGLLSPTRTALG